MSTTKPKSTAARVIDAQLRVESAMTELLEAAERYESGATAPDRTWRRQALLKSARRYGRAMDRLAVIRR